jgi:hypothetical protein
MSLARRVDARDVLDANATAARGFPGRVVGRYARSGPNAWDDYALIDGDGGPIDVYAGTPVQLEAEGAVVRMRRKGEVIVVEWRPAPGEVEAGADPRAVFLDRCLSHQDPTPDGSMGHWLHGELQAKREAND